MSTKKSQSVHSSKLFFSLIVFITILSFFAVLISVSKNKQLETLNSEGISSLDAKPSIGTPRLISKEFRIEQGSSFYRSLLNLDIDSPVIEQITRTANSTKFNLASLRPNTRGKAIFNKNIDINGNEKLDLIAVDLYLSRTKLVKFAYNAIDDIWLQQLEDIPVDKTVVSFNGTVALSLWESAKSAGMNPNLIDKLADIFAWQIDFSRGVLSGDTWRISVEQLEVEGEFIGFGNILAAEYINNGQKYTAIRFPKDGDKASYYDLEGQSLRRLFLKSPLNYRRISSKFQAKRFHPILKTNRPHLGVDYAADPGTPVKSVGDGTVEFATWKGGGGRVVRIRHNSKYSTAYMHLQGYGKGIRQGVRVSQGQVIGYVGSSGLATGPHLHFEFYENGRYVDPLGIRFPAADPIPQQKLAEFKTFASQSLDKLNNLQLGASF